MSVTPPTHGTQQPTGNEGNRAIPSTDRIEVQNLAEEALSAEPSSSGYVPRWANGWFV